MVTTINKFSCEIKKVQGECKTHGKIDVDYDSFEELGIGEH